MANIDNLRPIPFDSERGRENQKKSAQARRRNKTIAETTKLVLNEPVTDPKQLKKIKAAGLPVPDVPTYKDYVVASIICQTAGKGKIDDLQKLMEILGEQPPMQKDQGQTAALKSIVNAIKVNDDEDNKAEQEAAGDT